MEHHIDHYFDEALEDLKKQILQMGNEVSRMIDNCVASLKTKETALAKKTLELDHSVDVLEVEIDKKCIQLLVRYQPAAGDLRFITRGLKIVTDLERIGDMAVNFAQRVMEIRASGKEGPDLVELVNMAVVVQKMLQKSFNAFMQGNIKEAEEVLAEDDIVDDMTKQYVTEALKKSAQEPEKISILFPMTSIVRNLERIADHATNIAELTIYMVKGRDIRHGGH